MTINLIDARRGLHDKCLELFSNKNIAEQIYRYLCDGIEECETVEAEPIKHGRWIKIFEDEDSIQARCSACGMVYFLGKGRDPNYCGTCGARMDEVEE